MINNIRMNNKIQILNDIFTKAKEEEKEKSKFHQIIEKNKEFILNCYRKQPLYRDSINILEKANKGTFTYRRLIKSGIKNKSNFIKLLLRTILKLVNLKRKNQNQKN